MRTLDNIAIFVRVGRATFSKGKQPFVFTTQNYSLHRLKNKTQQQQKKTRARIMRGNIKFDVTFHNQKI